MTRNLLSIVALPISLGKRALVYSSWMKEAEQLLSFISPFLGEQQREFYGNADVLGSFWKESDILPVVIPEREQDHNSCFISNDSLHQQQQLQEEQQSDREPSFFTFHLVVCSKCKRSVPIQLFAAHEELCTAAMVQMQSESFSRAPSTFVSPSYGQKMPSSTGQKHLLYAQKHQSSSSNASRNACNKKRQPVVLDFDRHCGVLTDQGVHCIRALTCKSHSMSAKRAVVGRSMEFDKLLARHHANKAATSALSASSSIVSAKTLFAPASKGLFGSAGEHQQPISGRAMQSNAAGNGSPQILSPNSGLPNASRRKGTNLMQHNVSLLDAVLENDAYFDNVAQFSSTLLQLYRQSTMPVVVRKVEFAFPMTALEAKYSNVKK